MSAEVPRPQSPEESTDPQLLLVLGALAIEPEYEFRSPEAVARVSGLPIEEVTPILEGNPALIRRPMIPLENGRPLFTLAVRRPSWREKYTVIRSFLTKTMP